MSHLLIIKDQLDYGEDDKHACSLCKKPVASLYVVQLEEGGTLMVCRSDLHRILAMKSQSRKTADQAAPLFAGGNDRVR